ncbi:LamG domain-containing protein [Methylococcus mesophilus]|uniref:LamG domain-containing protein n=1 Tax=Methylococcus mesophilus TaxID=2993564 RepID=UPI00224B1E1C|nr:LamG domain-containing protein [Methylococcus mesophilus]UZR29077.1 LamG domain-containing protein [Methylococcus mesophilus]
MNRLNDPSRIRILAAAREAETRHVPASASPVTLLPANPDRRGFLITNTSQQKTLYLNFGAGAGRGHWSVVLAPGERYESSRYAGRIDAAWSHEPEPPRFIDETGRDVMKIDNSGGSYGVTLVENEALLGNGSLFFQGTLSWLQPSGGPEYRFGIEDFTIEFAARIDGYPRTVFAALGGDGDAFIVHRDADWRMALSTMPAAGGVEKTIITLPNTIDYGAWHRFAFTRSGDTYACFVDGVNAGTGMVRMLNHTGNYLNLGAGENGLNPMAGYLDEIRITKGIARYTADYVPDAAEFDLATDPYAGNVVLLMHCNAEALGAVVTELV